MRKKILALLVGIAVTSVTQIAKAEIEITPDADPVRSNLVNQIDISKFPLLRTNDWRTETNLPWSQPVVMVDEFEGNYLAVFDKNFQDSFWTGEKSGIVSNWSRKYLRIYSYYSRPCDGLFCQRVNIINQASHVTIKVRDNVFRLEGKAGNFNLTEALAYALKTSPSGRTRIKVMFEDYGREVINDIGEGTVQAWKTVYFDAVEPIQQSNSLTQK
ncbi:hypothetical protein [Chamaesiphon polymorphus]|uniref:Uncharacterized protein n=1 Tax=Chamaesiphon polymorphus CCALA 037 TaxID=2107692 RepID=A0A2T1G5B5_9CYAN|nr:hypothetical protein [Chamaesiphon polymorphus]PSB52441.1 hypothetical protein C7B77_20510 [Chamaesiphon polymorphus CCALA 037]